MDANRTAEQNIGLFIGAVQSKELRAFLDSNMTAILALGNLDGDAARELRQELMLGVLQELEARHDGEH